MNRRAFIAGAAAASAAALAACATGRRSATSPGARPSTPAGSETTASTAAPPGDSSTGGTAAHQGPGGPSSGQAQGPSGPRSGEAQGPAAFVSHGPLTGGGVALTFHTAGPASITTDILDQAGAVGAHLTFFVVGQWLAANPGMAQRILDGGHELANHTWSHVDIAHLDAAAMQAEITRCADVLQRQTGSIGRWFRPSQIDVPTPALLAQAAQAGYATCVGFDVDPLDYTDPPPAPALILSRTRARIHPGAIVSLHTLHPGTARAFGGIVAAIHARGLQAVTVSSVLGG